MAQRHPLTGSGHNEPILNQCWADDVEDGPTLAQDRVDVSCHLSDFVIRQKQCNNYVD